MGMLSTPKFEDDDTHGINKTTANLQSTAQKPALFTPPNPPRKPMTTASAPAGTRVTTGKIRGSYVKIFKAELPKTAQPGATPKFSITLLIPKEDTVTLTKIAAAQEAAIVVKWPGKRPARISTTLHDGDLPRPSSGEDFGPECKGHMVMTVSSKNRPKVIDLDNNEILDNNSVGSGDYFKVSINMFAYEVSGNKGVSAGLNNVLFLEKGVSLGGATSAADDFADDLNS